MDNNSHSSGETKHITFGFVVAWIFAVFVGVPGIMMLFEHQAEGGVVLILAALVALPPMNAFVQRKTKISLSSGLRVAAVIILCVIAGAVLSQGSILGSTPTASVPAITDKAAAAPEQVTQEASQPPVAPKVLLSIKGSGTKTTQIFTAAAGWDLSYTYNCSDSGLPQGNFQVYVYNSNGSVSLSNAAVNELGASGSDVEHYHSGGSFYLEVNSECSWTVTVKG